MEKQGYKGRHTARAIFPDHLEDEAELLDNWMVEDKRSDFERVSVLNCLSQRHLQNLPLPSKSRQLSANPTAQEWQYLFYRHIAEVLGFTKRTDFLAVVSEVSHWVWPEPGDVIPNVIEGGEQSCGKEKIVGAVPEDPGESQASSKTPPDSSTDQQNAFARNSPLCKQGNHATIGERGVPTASDKIICGRAKI